MKRHGCEFKDSLKALAEMAGVDLKPPEKTGRKKMTLAEKFRASIETEFPHEARNYLNGRGIINDTVNDLLDMDMMGWNPKAYAGRGEQEGTRIYKPAITFPMFDYTAKWECKGVIGIQNIFLEPVTVYDHGKPEKMTKRHEYGSKPSVSFFALGDVNNSEYQVVTEAVINLISVWQVCKDSAGCAIFSTSHTKKLKSVGLPNPLLFYDNDKAGRKATANSLNVLGDALVVQWTDNYPNKYDANDLLKDDNPEEIIALIHDAVKQEAKHPGEFKDTEFPTIQVNEMQLRDIKNMAWDALTDANTPTPKLWRNSKGIVELVENDKGQLEIREITVAGMRVYLSEIANWAESRYNQSFGSFQIGTIVPKVVAEAVLANRKPPLPHLKKIITSPIYTESGKLASSQGYSKDTQCYLDMNGLKLAPIPTKPKQKDVEKAKSHINELLWDFPFISDAEKANAIGFFILPFIKNMIDGLTPLHLFEASTAGTGKTLLVQLLSYPYLGRWISTKSEIQNNDELRKQITSSLMAGADYLFFDNLNYSIDSGILAQAATSETWEDRILSTNTNVNLDVRCIWAMTANNSQMSREILRRSVRIRQDAKMESPELRDPDSFRHYNIKKWIRTSRADLIWSALTLCQNWIAHGQPKPTGLSPMGSFEEWRDIIGGILQYAEIEGFLANAEAFREETDDETVTLRAFIGTWWDEFKDREVTTKDLYPLVEREGIPLNLNAKTERGQQVQFGNIVKKLKDRHFNINLDSDKMEVIVSRGANLKKAAQWKLVAPDNTCPKCGSNDSWKSRQSGKWACVVCYPPDENDIADFKSGG